MNYGYIRIETEDDDLDAQRKAISDWAEANEQIDEWIIHHGPPLRW